MSLVRKRSRGCEDMRNDASDMSARKPPSAVPSTPLRTAVVVAIALLAVFCLGLPLLGSIFSGHLRLFPGFHNDLQVNSDDAFLLHPADHVLRQAATFTHHWRITSGERRPDGVLKRVYLVNDAFPGPTLEARPGDHLVIRVENALEHDEGVSIHWHGLSMRHANDMDGAVGITQSTIEPGQTFVYDFIVQDDQHGTFWWHAHDGVQRADGLYGGLVVHEPAGSDATVSDDEHLLLVGDWYHRPAQDALQFYMHPGAFGLETVPDSMVVNGRGVFNCSNAVPARPLDCKQGAVSSLPELHFDASRRTLLRIVNVGAYAGFRIASSGSHMMPVALDGDHRVESRLSKSVGFLHPGERVSLLIHPDPHGPWDAQSTLEITLDDRPFKYENPALTMSHSFPLHWHGLTAAASETTPALYGQFDVQHARAAVDQTEVLASEADHIIVLYSLTQKFAHLNNEPHGFINNTRWLPQSPPLLYSARQDWDAYQLAPRIPYIADSPVWVDIVLNNLDEDNHPFHLHGHDFWVVSQHSSDFNWGSYNPFTDAEPPAGSYDLRSAMKRDTFYVPRRGYAVLRFRADNPGIWLFHCHVLWHQASGMAMSFDVR